MYQHRSCVHKQNLKPKATNKKCMGIHNLHVRSRNSNKINTSSRITKSCTYTNTPMPRTRSNTQTKKTAEQQIKILQYPHTSIHICSSICPWGVKAIRKMIFNTSCTPPLKTELGLPKYTHPQNSPAPAQICT